MNDKIVGEYVTEEVFLQTEIHFKRYLAFSSCDFHLMTETRDWKKDSSQGMVSPDSCLNPYSSSAI